MTAEDVINGVRESAGEWLEMTKHPDAFVSGVLAQRIVHLQDYIDHLEKRLRHDGCITSRIN